jgi:hypothetical protein
MDKYEQFKKNDALVMDGITSLSLLAQMYRSKNSKVKEIILTAQKQVKRGNR